MKKYWFEKQQLNAKYVRRKARSTLNAQQIHFWLYLACLLVVLSWFVCFKLSKIVKTAESISPEKNDDGKEKRKSIRRSICNFAFHIVFYIMRILALLFIKRWTRRLRIKESYSDHIRLFNYTLTRQKSDQSQEQTVQFQRVPTFPLWIILGYRCVQFQEIKLLFCL